MPLKTHEYGALARDLLSTQATDEELCKLYNLSKVEYHHLPDDPAFVKEMQAARAEYETLGATAPFVWRSRALAESGLEVANSMMKSNDTPATVRAKLFSDLVRFGHLDPGAQPKSENQGGPVGTTIFFGINVPGRAGLTLQAVPGKGASLPVIDASEDVDDFDVPV